LVNVSERPVCRDAGVVGHVVKDKTIVYRYHVTMAGQINEEQLVDPPTYRLVVSHQAAGFDDVAIDQQRRWDNSERPRFAHQIEISQALLARIHVNLTPLPVLYAFVLHQMACGGDDCRGGVGQRKSRERRKRPWREPVVVMQQFDPGTATRKHRIVRVLDLTTASAVLDDSDARFCADIFGQEATTLAH